MHEQPSYILWMFALSLAMLTILSGVGRKEYRSHGTVFLLQKNFHNSLKGFCSLIREGL